MKNVVYKRHIDNFPNHWWFQARKKIIEEIIKKNFNKKIDILDFGSGKKHSLKSFIYEAFRLLRIPRNHLKVNTKKFIRKKDIKSYRSDPRLAKKILKWKAKTSFKQIVKKMIYDELF